MRWHHPTWLAELSRRMPERVTLTHSGSTVYLFAAFPLRRDWLLGVIADALLAACETPGETPRETPGETLLETHSLTLLQTLCQTQTFLKICRKQGLFGAAYEIRIDEQEIMRLFLAARLQADCQVIMQAAEDECYMSVRKAQIKLAVMTGQWFSASRIAASLNELERTGRIKRNNNLRRYGRKVS